MSKLLMATASGEQHGLINTLTNSVQYDEFKSMKPEHKTQCEKQRKEDARIVKARYINHRGKHERLTKPYCRWAGDPIQMWHLIPGHTYDLPLGLINEVNAIKMPVRSGLLSVNGEDVKKDGSPLDKDSAGEAIHELVPASFL